MAPVREETIAVRGLGPLIRDMSRVSKTATRALRREIRHIAEPVKVEIMLNEATERFGRPSVSGVKVIVRQRGVNVEQTMRKSADLPRRRANFGKLQQTEAFDPGLAAHKEQVVADVEAFVDKLLAPVEGTLL